MINEEFTDLSGLFPKKDNDDALDQIEADSTESDEYLSSDEWNKLGNFLTQVKKRITDIEYNAIYGIRQGATTFYADDHEVTLTENIATIPTQGTSISVVFKNTNANFVSVNGECKLEFKAISVKEGSNFSETVAVEVLTAPTGSTNWTSRGTVNVNSRGDSSTQYDSVTLTSDSTATGDGYIYVGSGTRQLKLVGVGQSSRVEGSSDIATISLTSLKLVNKINYNTPIDASNAIFPISYQIYGGINKTLHVEITGSTSTYSTTYTIGTTQYDTENFSRNITDPNNANGILSHGVHTVTAWLTALDGDGNEVSSDKLVNQFMVINNDTATVSERTQPYLMLQGMGATTEVTNYVQANLCNYAVFVPKYVDGKIVADTDSEINLKFLITSYSENPLNDDNMVTYLTVSEPVKGGVQYNLTTTVEIEPASESEAEATSYDAYFRVWRYTTNNEGDVVDTFDFLNESSGFTYRKIDVDNSDSFTPTSGASFLINPKVRSNSEADFKRIYNAKADNAEIESVWTGFSGVNDGWITSSDDSQRVLRVLAGEKLTIKYNPFAQFLSDPNTSLTFEMDYKVRNVSDPEDEQIIGINETVGGSTIGLVMSSIRAYLLTKSNQVSENQDWQWQEDARTHVSINICNDVTSKEGANSLALVRVFINGVLNREFTFNKTDKNEFCTAALSNGGIVIGSSSADIDIYSLRCYTNQTLSPRNIVKNWIATLPTSAEKLQAREDNDILDSETNLITVSKLAEHKKRCLIWHGVEPYQMLSSKQPGYWEIRQYNDDGSINNEISGTIGKESYLAYLKDSSVNCLVASRQGSTANTYYWSNMQTKIKDLKNKITVKLSDFHSSITVVVNDDNTATITGGNIDGTYELVDNETAVQVVDGWVDFNGKYHGNGFQVATTVPLGQKMVNKINYASSMQSHLCGGVASYNDLHTAIVGKNDLQVDTPNARVSKYTEPFFFFVQETETAEPEYRGPSTFGPGKMDDVTWGLKKKVHKYFAMIEGAENNYPLTDMRVPFDENVTAHFDSGEQDGWNDPVKGDVAIDIDKFASSATDSEGNSIPSEEITNKIKAAWNFLYWHNPRITYYSNAYETFLTDDSLDTTMAYWFTSGTRKYQLVRYAGEKLGWVDAGMLSGSTYAVRDLSTDTITKSAFSDSSIAGDYSKMNSAIIAALAADAKLHIGEYFNVESLKFHYAYVNHFIAGTDNCSKNTYYVLAPRTKDGVTTWLIELHQDDLDTIFSTDNTGRQTKPYYIDRQHPYADGKPNDILYEGSANVLFNLVELMYEDSKELQTMLHNIFTTMCELVGKEDDLVGLTNNETKKTPWGFLHKYYFNVQNYFPAIAWNEMARIRYEYPASTGFVSTGGRSVPPLTQSLGNQLEAEKQYMKRRLIYAASYAAWGDFEYATTGSVGISDVASSFGFQGYKLPNGQTASYKISVTPHQYIYPTGNTGSNTVDPHVRLSPGQTYKFNLGTVDGDTGVAIFAANYYRSFGNVGDLSCKADAQFTLTGKRLIEFTAEPTLLYDGQAAFRPKQFAINGANALKSFSLKGCDGIKGSLDLSELIRVKTIDVCGTGITSVVLPESENLKKVCLPAKLTELTLDDVPNLNDLTLEGYSALKSIKISDNVGALNTQAIISSCYDNNAPLESVSIANINWTNASATILDWLLDVKSLSLSGRIELASNVAISYSTKMKLVSLFGNIDSETNSLYIKYKQNGINTIEIACPTEFTKVGTYTDFSISTLPTTGNNIKINNDGTPAITWSISSEAAAYAEFTDSANGVFKVKQLEQRDSNSYHTVTVSVELLSGKTLTASTRIHLFRRIPEVGDFAWHDGSFSNAFTTLKTLVGIVYRVVKVSDAEYTVHIDAAKTVNVKNSAGTVSAGSTLPWGLFNSTDTNGFSTDVATEIMNATGWSSTGSVFDIAELTNYTSTGLGNGSVHSSGGYLEKDNYIDETTDDGYKTISSGSVTDFNHKSNTDKIVAHANAIIDKYLDKSRPETTEELADLMYWCQQQDQTGNMYTKYWQLCYPAAYACRVYAPTVADGQVLDDAYKAGSWDLPATGDAGRIYNFYHASRNYVESSTPTSTYAVDEDSFNVMQEALKPVFAQALKRMEDAGVTSSGYGTYMTLHSNSYHWCSTECGSNGAWNMYFTNGNCNGNGYGKGNRCVVRAVVAYPFTL
jgi:hypothetical protein